MQPTEKDLDDEAVRFLVNYHQALLEGSESDRDTPPETDSGLSAIQGCLRRLESDRRRSAATPAGDSTVPARVGRFRLIRELGHGSFGIVFLADDPVLHRQVAVKVPRPEALFTSDLRQRFLREARAAAGLDHPHIVPVHEAGEADHVCYISSAYCPGPTLAAWLKEQPNLPSPRTAAALVATLADAMQHAHDRGVLHRDLKPGNILLAGSRESGIASRGPGDAKPASLFPTPDSLLPRITDFGLAKLLEQDEQNTRSGAILGTPGYMAPEQAGGNQEIGPAADIHALGAILYEMLTGRPPFQGPSILETLEQVRSQEPVAPRRLQPTVPRDLELICLKCLEKALARRYARAEQLAEELRRYLEGRPLALTRPVGRGERCWRWCRRNPGLAVASGVAAVMLAGVVVVSLLFGITASRDAGRLREAADALRDKQKETDKALGDARKSAQEATDNRHWAERQSVELVCDRGLALCDQGDVGAGLLWLARSLEIAERAGAADDLRRAIRINLGGWSRELHPVRLVLPHQAGYVATALLEPNAGATLKGNPRPPGFGHRALAFTADSRALATCLNRTARLWDTATGQPLGPSLHHEGTVNVVAFSPDGQTLVTGSSTGQVRFWDPRTGQLRRATLDGQAAVTCMAIRADGQYLAIGDGRVAVWDLKADKFRHPSLQIGVNDLAFGPDGKLLLAASGGAARLFDVDTGQAVGQAMTPEPGDNIQLAAFGPDGKTCAATWFIAKLWEVPSGKPIGSPLKHDRGGSFALVYSPDGRQLLTTCTIGLARLWDTTTGELLRELPNSGGLMTAAFSPDGRTCVYGGAEGKLRLCDPKTGRLVGPPLEHEGVVLYAVYSPDGQTILTWNSRGIVQLWDAGSASLVPQAIPTPTGTRLAAWSPDGRTFATTGPDDTAQVRDSRTGNPMGAALQHQGTIRALAYRPDGKMVLTASADRTARLWDAETGAALQPQLRHEGSVEAVYWNSDGTKILTVTSAKKAQRWDATTGEPIGATFAQDPNFGCGRSNYRKPPQYPHPGTFVFDSDGRVIQAVSKGTTVWLTEASSGKALGGPIRHASQVDALALSADGRYLMTGSSDMTARLWDTATGQPLGGPLNHQEQTRGVAISPDGRRALTTGIDRRVRLWDVKRSAPVGSPIAGATLMSFSEDSRMFFTAGGTTLRAWDSSTGKALGPPLTSPSEITALEVSQDGTTVWTLGSDNRRWQVTPLPLPGKPERITCWIQSITGLHLDSGGVARGLSAEEWQANRTKLVRLGGPPTSPSEPLRNEGK
jgi:WD40 repeat protein/serine/threonine protein kinase